jgi:hypothetical protein
MSSAALLSFVLGISIYCYDRIMRRHLWRWQALITILSALIVAIFLLANRPVSWIVSHLTLDPATGYFRKATWDSATHNIGLSPLTGYGFDTVIDANDFFSNASVDSVWLVLALRSGVPVVIFVFLANIASFFASGRRAVVRNSDPYMDNMRTGFTLALAMFMFTGLTVHYWNNMWIFWGLCIGIRASLQEQYFDSVRPPAVIGPVALNRDPVRSHSRPPRKRAVLASGPLTRS